MNERVIVNSAPKVITDWLQFPYDYFSRMVNGDNTTLLDIAAGNNEQINILRQYWDNVLSLDFSTDIPGVGFGDITQIPLNDNAVDWIFSFETIEHLPEEVHLRILCELERVCKVGFVIGTVNLVGPTFLDGHEIWKAGRNEFHIKEYTHFEWMQLFNDYSLFGSQYNNGIWSMEPGVSEHSVSLYAVYYK